MVRFGADEIFASKSKQLTDEDIDVLLKRGEVGSRVVPLELHLRLRRGELLGEFRGGRDRRARLVFLIDIL